MSERIEFPIGVEFGQDVEQPEYVIQYGQKPTHGRTLYDKNIRNREYFHTTTRNDFGIVVEIQEQTIFFSVPSINIDLIVSDSRLVDDFSTDDLVLSTNKLCDKLPREIMNHMFIDGINNLDKNKNMNDLLPFVDIEDMFVLLDARPLNSQILSNCRDYVFFCNLMFFPRACEKIISSRECSRVEFVLSIQNNPNFLLSFIEHKSAAFIDRLFTYYLTTFVSSSIILKLIKIYDNPGPNITALSSATLLLLTRSKNSDMLIFTLSHEKRNTICKYARFDGIDRYIALETAKNRPKNIETILNANTAHRASISLSHLPLTTKTNTEFMDLFSILVVHNIVSMVVIRQYIDKILKRKFTSNAFVIFLKNVILQP